MGERETGVRSSRFLEVGEDCFQLLVGGLQTAAAFAQEFGGAPGVGREKVYVAAVALHVAEYGVEFGSGLSVGKLGNGGKLRLFHKEDGYCCGRMVLTVEVNSPEARRVVTSAPAGSEEASVTARPWNVVREKPRRRVACGE